MVGGRGRIITPQKLVWILRIQWTNCFHWLFLVSRVVPRARHSAGNRSLAQVTWDLFGTGMSSTCLISFWTLGLLSLVEPRGAAFGRRTWLSPGRCGMSGGGAPTPSGGGRKIRMGLEERIFVQDLRWWLSSSRHGFLSL